MATRRSFLRGLLTLPAAPLALTLTPPPQSLLAPPLTAPEPLPCEFSVLPAGEVHIHGRLFINGQELGDCIAKTLRETALKHGYKPL